MQAYFNDLEQLFYATDIYGWFGPLLVICISFIVLTNKKYKPLGIFFIIVQSLIAYQYLTLVSATPWYWWNIIIMILGIITCSGMMAR